MYEIERNTEETENSKKEGLREEDITQKGCRKMCTYDVTIALQKGSSKDYDK
jgi:hypothetical protein